MKIIVVGYGRTGSQLVRRLDLERHEVVIIDKDPAVFQRVGRHVKARVMVGNGIDIDLLRQAGAEGADAFFAMTRDENTNLMAGQIARTAFNIGRVFAVIYDPKRIDIYEAMGIETFCLTAAAAEYLADMIEKGKEGETFSQAVEVEKQRDVAELQMLPQAVVPSGEQQYALIMGGGKVGYYLGRELLRMGYEVAIIESRKEVADLVAAQINCPVIVGDGSTHQIQEEAGAARASLFVAVTGHDHDNLVACQVARKHFNVRKTIARVSNPKNERLLRQLGVDAAVSSTSLIIAEIERELPTARIKRLLSLQSGEVQINEYQLVEGSPAVGKQLKDLVLPSECNLVSVIRNGNIVIPRGETTLYSGDFVMALVRTDSEPEVRRFLLGE